MVMRRLDGPLLAVLTVGLLVLVVVEGADLRQFSSALGVAVFGLIVWRLVSTCPRLTVLEHALSMLLASSPLVSSLATYALLHRAGGGLPDNPWLWLVVAHRAACLVLVVFWNHWLGRRTSPFRRTPTTTTHRRGRLARA